MLNQVFQLAIALGGVLAMLRIGYAGWLYMGSEDMWSSKTHAKEVFRDAIIGLLILLAIWLILNQINPDMLKLKILQTS
jgi:threonine/homoserine/homoserine lactone efflux protein